MEEDSEITKSSDPFVGRMIEDRYLIQKKIGEGGVGAVYLAEDTKMMKRQVVVKILHEKWSKNSDIRRKFEHEKEALARLDHPGIVSILDAGILPEDKPYLIMPFISGRTLRQVLKNQKKLPLDFCADVIESFSEALETAHEAGVLHRDIKPENMILTEQKDQRVRVRLIDFGIARVMNSQVSPITEVERLIGTILYMAPEQLLGSLDQTPATDIYSCGMVAYEMLTGMLPFIPNTIVEMYQFQKDGVIQKPSAVRRELSSNVDNIILRALSFESEKRYGKVSDFGRSLAEALRKLNERKTAYKGLGSEHTLHIAGENTLLIDAAKTIRLSGETAVKGGKFVVKDEKQKDSPPPDSTQKSEAKNLADDLKKLNLEPTKLPSAEQPKENKPLLHRNSTWIGAIAIMLAAVIIPLLIYLFNNPTVEVPPIVDGNTTTDQPVFTQNLEFYLEIQKLRGEEEVGELFRATGLEMFNIGDAFWMNVSANTGGNIYLFYEGIDDKINRNTFYLMFPTERQNGSPGVEADQRIKTGGYKFTGSPGKEYIWIVWTKEPVKELEDARKDALRSGKVQVQKSEIAQRLSDFLQKYSGNQLEVRRHSEKKGTSLQSNSNIMVYQIELMRK